MISRSNGSPDSQYFQSGRPVVGLHDRVAYFIERIGDLGADLGLILDEKGFPSMRRASAIDVFDDRPIFGGRVRQPARSPADKYARWSPGQGCFQSARTRPIASRNRKSAADPTRSLAGRFCCEERFEDAAQYVVAHAHAIVRHLDLNIVSGLRIRIGQLIGGQLPVRRRDPEHAAFRHGVASVDRQIQQSALKLSRVAAYAPAGSAPSADPARFPVRSSAAACPPCLRRAYRARSREAAMSAGGRTPTSC